MASAQTAAGLRALLASPQPDASIWLRWHDRVDVLAGIDACGLFLRLVLPVGSARRSNDVELASNLLRWNAEHLDVGSPCFSLDERDGAICLGTAVSLSGLGPEMAGDAVERLVAAADEVRALLADAILFVD